MSNVERCKFEGAHGKCGRPATPTGEVHVEMPLCERHEAWLRRHEDLHVEAHALQRDRVSGSPT